MIDFRKTAVWEIFLYTILFGALIFALLGYFSILAVIFGPMTLTLPHSPKIILPMQGWTGVAYALILFSLLFGVFAVGVSLFRIFIDIYTFLRRVILKDPVSYPPEFLSIFIPLSTFLCGWLGYAGWFKASLEISGGADGVIATLIFWFPLLSVIILLSSIFSAVKEALPAKPKTPKKKDPAKKASHAWTQTERDDFNWIQQNNPSPPRTASIEQFLQWIRQLREGAQELKDGIATVRKTANWFSIGMALLSALGFPEGEAQNIAMEMSEIFRAVSESEALKTVEQLLVVFLGATDESKSIGDRVKDTVAELLKLNFKGIFHHDTIEDVALGILGKLAEKERQRHKEKLLSQQS